jgi:hypothetical protein
MGRYDADYGTILINKGQADFEAVPLNGIAIKGQVRRMKQVTVKGRSAYIFACNNDSTRVAAFEKK